MNDPALDGFMLWFLSFALLTLGVQETFVWALGQARKRVRRARLRRRNRAAYRRIVGAIQKAGTYT
jgi:hypothetical protein